MDNESQLMKPSRYLDNDSNERWEWHNDGEKIEIVTMHDHPKPHMHKADVTKVPIGEIVDNPDPIIGEAHRNSAHYYKDGTVKPPKNDREKDSTNMSSKEHKSFCKRLNPSNYGNGTEPSRTTRKKSSNNEDDNKGQLEQTLPEPKNTKSVQKMKSDMKADLNKAKIGNKQNTIVKTQSIESKVTEGKSTCGESGKTTNGSIGKGGSVSGGKGGIGDKGGKGGNGDSGGGHSGGSIGGHSSGPGSGSGRGHGGGGHGGR